MVRSAGYGSIKVDGKVPQLSSFFFVLAIVCMSLNLLSVSAHNITFVELNVSNNYVKTGETFILYGSLMNNSTETITTGHITFVIPGSNRTMDCSGPIRVSHQGLSPTGYFLEEVKPGEYVNFSYVLKIPDPGKFLILIEASTNVGYLRSEPLEVEGYSESVNDDETQVGFNWILVGALSLVASSGLILTILFIPRFRSIRFSIVAGFKGLKEKSLETISTSIAISLILALPQILLPFLTITESSTFLINIFLRTYGFALFFGLPAFTILHGVSTRMPIRSFLIPLILMVTKTLIENLTSLYPFTPLSLFLFDLSLAFYLGLIGAGTALIKERKMVGYTLLALGIILWVLSLLGGILTSFSITL